MKQITASNEDSRIRRSVLGGLRRTFVTHYVIVAGVASALLSAALAGCSARPAAATPANSAEPIAVSIARVAMTDVASAIDSGGVVQARTTASITARILAPVRKVLVSPGDHVREGQTLIVLDGEDLAAGASASRSAVLTAEQGSKADAAEAAEPQQDTNAGENWRPPSSREYR